MPYYYTQTVIDAETGRYEVAKEDNGVNVSAMGDLIGGINVLLLDRNISPARYILDCPDGQQAQAGWEQKTAEEINAEYPNLVRG